MGNGLRFFFQNLNLRADINSGYEFRHFVSAFFFLNCHKISAFRTKDFNWDLLSILFQYFSFFLVLQSKIRTKYVRILANFTVDQSVVCGLLGAQSQSRLIITSFTTVWQQDKNIQPTYWSLKESVSIFLLLCGIAPPQHGALQCPVRLKRKKKRVWCSGGVSLSVYLVGP